MFFDEERILSVREMILSKTKEDRAKALEKLLPHQKKDFIEIFKIMSGLPVTVRLLDPPLHEFLPRTEKEISEVANVVNLPIKQVESRIEELHEQNPMLGHRGCRLGISFPEIYEMQCRAIFEALAELKKKKIKSAFPEIMIPLVSTEAEIKIMKELVINIASDVQKKHKIKIHFMVGTMIELPRAAIKAKEIAKHAEFFSFGTNDLTQTTFGISRDDSGKFLNDYLENKIFSIDPFVSIDEGVADLIEIAVEKGKKQNKKLKLGICGEHGGDPKSIAFCSKVGLNYVSCSPYRVPIARLAAAQAEILKNFIKKNKIKSAYPEIMIPLVSTEAEIKIMKELVINVASDVQNKHKIKIHFMVGTMIELPRAAIKAKEIAKHAEFFSFGTNDLTQTTFGISRDDSGKFLNDYLDNKIFSIDPFVSIDDGVADLVEIAVEKGKKQNKKLKLGICGEHGGDPKSIMFCSKVGLNYVSCSPYRVPIARLAAAQAELGNQTRKK